MRARLWLSAVSCLSMMSIAACSDDASSPTGGAAGSGGTSSGGSGTAGKSAGGSSASGSGAGGSSASGSNAGGTSAGGDGGSAGAAAGNGGNGGGGGGAGNGGSGGASAGASGGGAGGNAAGNGGGGAGNGGNSGSAGASGGGAGGGGASGNAGASGGGAGGASGGGAGGASGGGGGGAGGSSTAGTGGGGSVDPSPLCARDLWKYTFQFCPHTQDAGNNQPTLAVDGNTATFVTSGAAQNGAGFALFDLHGSVDVDTITLDYGGGEKAPDAAATLTVQGSADGVTFTDIVTGVSGALTANKLTLSLPGTTGYRFIKLLQVGSSGAWWAIPEIDISCSAGTQATVPADVGVATNRAQWKITTPNSSCPTTGPVGNMVDADAAVSDWQSGGRPGVGYWIHVDMGATAALKGVHIQHKAGDFPPTLRVQVSTDGVHYTNAAVAVTGGADLNVAFASTQTARFFRVVSEADTANAWWSVTNLDITL